MTEPDYKGFASALVDLSRDGLDIDGCDFQDLAVKHGILTPVVVYEACGEHCACLEYHGDFEDGVTCYRKAWK